MSLLVHWHRRRDWQIRDNLAKPGPEVTGTVTTAAGTVTDRDHLESCQTMEVSEVALNGSKRFAGITILEGYNANISIVAALWADSDSDGTRDKQMKLLKTISKPRYPYNTIMTFLKNYTHYNTTLTLL